MSAPAPSPAFRRDTRQRRAVAEVVDSLEAFASAQEIHQRLRAEGERVGLATVYRNLQVLAEDGEVDTLRTDDGEVRYRRCGTAHHHHLVCRSCGRVVEVRSPDVESWAARVAAQHGFVDAAHSVEVTGLCAACAAAR